jgi:drug/metabolite transporter (DMT)-like permease
VVSAPGAAAWSAALAGGGLLLLVSVVIFSVNIAVQHGLAHVSANRAIVIYLFELVVAAFSAWLLAGETLVPRDWCGGAMIIAAGWLSERIAAHPAAPATRRD